jgi:DNA helicase-2/ATP-dependent DNA helicase PcrA
LIDYDVPYRIIGGVRFYERKEIKDILAYLKLLNNPIDLVSLERVINVPARGIGEKTVRQVLEYLKGKKGVNENMLLLLAGQQKILPFISLLKEFLALLPQLKVSELIETVVKQTGYLDYLEKTEDNFKERLENLAELQTAAKRFDELVGSDGLTAFLESTSLVSDIDELDVNQSALTLMTIHSAKGLEFPYVFMVGMEQGLLPHYASLENPLDLEEERRLCYVGITRAKEKLYLTYTRERTLYGTTRYPKLSEFIAGLEDGVVERIGWTDTNS